MQNEENNTQTSTEQNVASDKPKMEIVFPFHWVAEFRKFLLDIGNREEIEDLIVTEQRLREIPGYTDANVELNMIAAVKGTFTGLPEDDYPTHLFLHNTRWERVDTSGFLAVDNNYDAASESADVSNNAEEVAVAADTFQIRPWSKDLATYVKLRFGIEDLAAATSTEVLIIPYEAGTKEVDLQRITDFVMLELLLKRELGDAPNRLLNVPMGTIDELAAAKTAEGDARVQGEPIHTLAELGSMIEGFEVPRSSKPFNPDRAGHAFSFKSPEDFEREARAAGIPRSPLPTWHQVVGVDPTNAGHSAESFATHGFRHTELPSHDEMPMLSVEERLTKLEATIGSLRESVGVVDNGPTMPRQQFPETPPQRFLQEYAGFSRPMYPGYAAKTPSFGYGGVPNWSRNRPQYQSMGFGNPAMSEASSIALGQLIQQVMNKIGSIESQLTKIERTRPSELGFHPKAAAAVAVQELNFMLGELYQAGLTQQHPAGHFLLNNLSVLTERARDIAFR